MKSATTRFMSSLLVLIWFVAAGAPSAAESAGQQGRGIGGILNENSPNPPSTKPQPNQATNPQAPKAENVEPDIEKRIASLKASLASKRPESFADLAGARRRVTEYHQRVDRMRQLMYIRDPLPDQKVSQVLDSFRKSWGPLSNQINTGQLPSKPLDSSRWNGYSPRFERLYCQNNVRLVAPPKGVQLVGWSWACLSDLFFRELSTLEARTADLLESQRTSATADLEKAMQLVETKLALADGLDNSPTAFRNEIARLLHEVDMIGTRLRIRELEDQRADGQGTASFRWFLEVSPAISRPLNGSASAPGKPSKASLKIKLGRFGAEGIVEGFPETFRLARELHRVHYRIARMKADGSLNARKAADAEEIQRARILQSLSEQAQ